MFNSHLNRTLFNNKRANVSEIVFPLYRDSAVIRIFLEQTLIPLYVKKLGIDVLFSPGNFAAIVPGCKQVITVQNVLSFKELRNKFAPRQLSKLKTVYHDLMLPLSVKRAAKIIAVSETVKSCLINHLSTEESKIRVIYEGVEHKLLSNAVGSLPLRFKPYVLFVSTLFPYKNADKLINAFSLLKHRGHVPHRLVIIGRDPGNEISRLKTLAGRLGLTEEVAFLGALPFETVSSFYRHAAVLVYPSSVESFGLPVLEAMACGVPVIGSDKTAVPEIIGAAGLTVNPDNITALSETMHTVLTNETLRKKLIHRGYRRAASFSWESAALETLRLFEEVYQSKENQSC